MTIQAEDGPANDVDDGAAATGKLHDAAESVRDAASTAKAAAADALANAKEKVGDALGTVKEKSGAAYVAAVDKASETYGTARDKAGDVYDAAREKAAGTYDAARDKAADAYEAAREKASAASRAAADGIDGNPIAALVGGIALGVLVGALLPRTEREIAALGPLASKLSEGARAATAAAREAGQEKLDELGINRATARDTVSKLLDTAVKAATSAGTAAADTVKQP